MNQQSSVSYVSEAVLPPEPPPLAESGTVAWVRENLFSSPFNTVATLLSLVFIAWAVPPSPELADFQRHLDCRQS